MSFLNVKAKDTSRIFFFGELERKQIFKLPDNDKIFIKRNSRESVELETAAIITTKGLLSYCSDRTATEQALPVIPAKKAELIVEF